MGQVFKYSSGILDCWTEEGLSYVASAVGKPLYADSLNETTKRISSDENRGSKMKQEWVKVNHGAAPFSIPSGDLNLGKVSSVGTKVEEASNNGGGQSTPLSNCISEDVPITGISILPLPILRSEVHIIAANSKKEVVDTSDKFLALIEEEEEAYSNEDSPAIASPDISLWHSKIKNIDEIPIVGLSSTSEASRHKKKKWNSKASKSSKVGDVTVKLNEAKEALEECQHLLDAHPTDNTLRLQENDIINSYTMALQAEAGTLQTIIHNHISNDQADLISKGVTNEEIRDVCVSLNPNKAPGPDGFHAHFFKKTWDIVGGDILNEVHEFFRTCYLLKELNTTILALVPKVPNPSRMMDFRPISCCNTLYIIIAKIIRNRIKIILTNIISPPQLAFVAGRRIGDNILLVQELMRNYHKDDSSPKCSLKVDLMKAFDTVDKRGLRQGDTMSPYLFVIAKEVLTKLLAKHIQDSQHYKYHWKFDKIKLSHLCFADDLIMLCHGSTPFATILKMSLDDFSSLSGLKANLAKGNIFLSSVPNDSRQQLNNIFGYNVGSLPISSLDQGARPRAKATARVVHGSSTRAHTHAHCANLKGNEDCTGNLPVLYGIPSSSHQHFGPVFEGSLNSFQI
ncbi:hypothetical protein Dsin_005879 [Dipteronia sinensis]|uniref:Reverse transcriptase domain-containing protein n=1 Tax=Dipteronia sinensis TaxID=43782 RepID=A0AAE0AYL6_9ROSI|nr:hypothetical protein Dsin_005879 [Dipteronia sinensis]